MQDEEAWRIVVENEPLVKYVIRRKFMWLLKSVRSITYDDLLQAGLVGLFKGVKRYDESKGTLATYCVKWICQEISRTIYNLGFCSVRIPVYIPDLHVKLKKKYGDNYSVEELYRKKVITRVQRNGLVTLMKRAIEIDSLEEEAKAILIPGEYDSDALRQIKQVKDTFFALDEVEKRILNKRFGLDGEEAKTLQQVSKMENVSHETVRRIQNRAIKKIKEIWRKK